ncbi:hypothetical protein KR093_000184, partial [Drosophila rubida]
NTLGMTQNSDEPTEERSETTAELPAQLLTICKELAENASIVFKSQQIDDPELNFDEKQQIAREAFIKNRENFLQRFGSYLTDQQLNDLHQLVKDDEDTRLLLEEFKRKLHTRKVCIKNRRYQAMQQLLQQGEYFSDHEMMQRAPDLYQELVGQHLTVDERKQRDSYDVRNTSFSGILMHTLEQQQRDELLQQMGDKTAETEPEPDPGISPDCEVPDACRQQWGGFEDDAPVACSTSRSTTTTISKLSTPDYYNPAERELLRNEFMGLMKERFLSGQDLDFDYSAVDDNAQLDDLKQLERDEEDAYFDGSEDDDEAEHKEHQPVLEEDDDLDVYMRHLNQHHSLQQH